MKAHTLSPAPGSVKRRKRVGRGNGSGHGTYSGYGRNGQKARAAIFQGFEGGQTPLHRRLPLRRGFTKPNRSEWAIVNVGSLDAAFEDGAEVTAVELIGAGLIKNDRDGVRVLGSGEVTKKLTVKAAHFTESAKQKLEKAGGSWEVI
jgi:large subunit ribosomal protein L15